MRMVVVHRQILLVGTVSLSEGGAFFPRQHADLLVRSRDATAMIQLAIWTL